MSDFAQGRPLARLSLIGGEGAQDILKASLETEVTLVMVAVNGDALFSLFHDLDRSNGVPVYTFDTALLFNYPLTNNFHGVVLAAQGIGAAIHMEPRQNMGVSCNVPATVTLYGVTTPLGDIR